MGSLLADLSKHKRYEIRLSVYNAVGEGPSSAPQEVFVGEAGMFPLALCRTWVSLLTFNVVMKQKENVLLFTLCSVLVPTSPPQSVLVQSSTATQLDVTWDPPPLDAQNGDIQGYKVSIMCLFFSMLLHISQLTSHLSYIFTEKCMNSALFILFIDLFLGVSAPE